MFGWGRDYYPEDMLNEYKNIAVNAAGSTVTISVNKYRNNDHGNYPSPEKGGTQDALKVKDSMLSLGAKDVLARAGGASPFVGVFVGKGSPQAIAAVMEMLVDYSDRYIERFRKSGGVTKKVADWLADENLSWQATLQNVSNEVVGLDCNGFVGNWAKHRDSTSKIEANTPQKYIYSARKKKARRKIDEIQPMDFIVWANMSHIAAIDWRLAPDAPKFNICQSAGGGPRMNEYLVSAKSDGTFTLLRPSPKGDVGGPVYIVPYDV
jgi:hypothetical protein